MGTGVEDERGRLRLLNPTTSWGTRQDLDGTTIETILKEIDDIGILGDFEAADRVPYPVTGMDVGEAVRFIIEKGLVGLFNSQAQSAIKRGVPEVSTTYELPVSDKTKYGRSTPKISLQLESSGRSGLSKGELYHTYDDRHRIVHWLGIPTNPADK